jgi:hypothetical protein
MKQYIPHAFIAVLIIFSALVASVRVIPRLLSHTYSRAMASDTNVSAASPSSASTGNASTTIVHRAPPETIKGIYVTNWVAGTPSLLKHIFSIVDTTEINTVEIDIKDATGRIGFTVKDPYLVSVGSAQRRIPDIVGLISELHKKGIYVIGRIATFQDPFFAKLHPEYAVKESDGVTIWKDKNGESWLDPGSEKAWDYVIAIAKEAYADGFDEVNFDYVRFPSDGDMNNISFPFSGPAIVDAKTSAAASEARAAVIKRFFSYLSQALRGSNPAPLSSDRLKISADLFGMTTTVNNDMGIGQIFVNALPFFDYVDPMVYPSHYSAGDFGFSVPAAHPYDVVHEALEGAVTRKASLLDTTSTITPAEPPGAFTSADIAGMSPVTLAIIRPWLQDFDLGAIYTAAMVRDQIRATSDVGLSSWLMWDASNVYTNGAFLPK